MRLCHLLLVIGLELPLMVALTSVLATWRPDALSWPFLSAAGAAAASAAILVAGPVSRRLRMPPLMVFAGPCPGCGVRPEGWWLTEKVDERLTLMCVNCEQSVVLWMNRAPSAAEIVGGVPNYVMRWPSFLGIWRRTPGSPQ